MFISKEKIEWIERKIEIQENELSGLRSRVHDLEMQAAKLEYENKVSFQKKKPDSRSLLGLQGLSLLAGQQAVGQQTMSLYDKISVKDAIEKIIDHLGIEFVKTPEAVTLEKKKKEK